MKHTYTRLSLAAVAAAFPLLVFAQTSSTIPSLFTYILNILNGIVVPLIFAIAFIMFIWGVYNYFIRNGGNAEKVQEGQKFVLWSVIGFVVMFSIWGIINIFLNTLGFNTSAQPAFPTFNAGTSGTSLLGGSNSLSCLFGGCSTNTNTNGTNGLGAVGSTFTDPSGTTYTVTGANTYAPNNGSCGSMGTLIGSNCLLNSSVANNANGTVQPGGSCTDDNNCADQGGQSYGCYKPAGAATGSCTADGDAPSSGAAGASCNSSADCTGNSMECNITTHTCQADNGLGQQGDSCTSNNDCQGNYVCDENSMTCQDPNAAGVSAVGEGQGNVGQGGSCNSSADCQSNLECNTNTQTCQPDNGLGQQGDQCSSDNDCDGNLICDTNSGTCQNPNAAGTNETGDGSGSQTCDDGSTPAAGNSCVQCPDGSTSADANLCPQS